MAIGLRPRRPLDRGQRCRADLGVQPHHIIARGQFVAPLPKRFANHTLDGISRHRVRCEALADNQAQPRLRRRSGGVTHTCIAPATEHQPRPLANPAPFERRSKLGGPVQPRASGVAG